MTDPTTTDDYAVRVLSISGAMCGTCGDEPGDQNCADCERIRRGYIADLRAAGWAPVASAVSLPPADQTAPSRRAGLRDEIAAALEAADYRMDMRRGDLADAVLPVLYREWPWLRAEAEDTALPATASQTAEPPLSPDYSHEACGFHWHGRDGMDIPMRDGQPVCPRCELAKVTRLLEHTSKRREEVGAECKRRGKRVLEQSEQILRLERQIDEVQRQLGAEILRAGQAETEVERLRADRAAILREAADAVDSGKAPFPNDVKSGASWAARMLRRMADETPAAETTAPVQHAPGKAVRCPDCRTKGYTVCLDEPAVGARQDGAQP
jgi:hypothetical protein